MRNTSYGSIARGAAWALVLGVIAAPAVSTLGAQDPQQPYNQTAAFTADQLDNLVAPVALYPDPLLAQVLLAATFPDQVRDAAQYVRANGSNGIDEQYWDVSVKAVAHYPTVLNLMDQRIDWTTQLGQAYAQQSSDVMASVQHMRALAQQQGNLVSTQQQQVVTADDNICIWPAQAQYIYVPVYDPAVVFYRPLYYGAAYHGFFSFGVGYPIGAWLIYDWNWPARRIYYTGWQGGGWIARSRPYIRPNSWYSNPRYENPNAHNAGRTAVPRGGQGVMTPGGYHGSRQAVAGDSRGRSTPMVVRGQPAQARSMPTVEQRPARTMPPVDQRPAYTRPEVVQQRPVYTRPQVEERPAYTRPQVVERQPQAAPRVAEPRGRSAPSQGSRSAPSQSRSAHHHG